MWRDDVAITDPRKLRAYRGTAGETYKASVLFHYPGGEASPNFAVDEVAAFCFPHGVEPRLLERTPSMSKLQEIMCGTTYTDGDDQVFVFQVQTSDNTPMYGVCAYVTEVLHQPPPIVQHLRGAPAADAYGANDSPSREARPLKHRYIEVAPRCYCILSKVPFFETHYEVLSHVLGMERVERIKQNMHDLMPDDEGNDGDQWARSPPASSDGNEAMEILENYSRVSRPGFGRRERRVRSERRRETDSISTPGAFRARCIAVTHEYRRLTGERANISSRRSISPSGVGRRELVLQFEFGKCHLSSHRGLARKASRGV